MGDLSHLFTARNSEHPRRICIIGAGLSGLGYLNGLLDLPEEARAGWEIDLYEHRLEAGGVWTPQPNKPAPPELPETPAYEGLESITLGTGFTFPHRPLPPSSLLFPPGETIHEYIRDHVRHFKLDRYIRVGHTVMSASLDRSKNNRYPWTLTVQRLEANGNKHAFTKSFTTLIVANGVHPTPNRLHLPGESQWLAGGSKREVLHSMWFNEPSIGNDRVVVVVGNHPSGSHIACVMCNVAKEVHHVYVPDLMEQFTPLPSSPNYKHHTARLDRYNVNEIVLSDGTTITTPQDAIVIECTGYWREHPFLPEGVVHRVKGDAFNLDSFELESNDRYLRPLYKTIIPIDSSIPVGSLAFACLFPVVWTLPTSYAQGLWLAHLLADIDENGEESTMLAPSAEEALKEVREMETQQKKMGSDMMKKGYFLLPPGIATDNHTDHLIREVRKHSSYPLPRYLEQDPSREFTDPWRRRAFELTLPLVKGWRAAKEAGIAASFSVGAKTEEDFAKAADKLAAWWEGETGKPVISEGP